jgi:hypothetical protein
MDGRGYEGRRTEATATEKMRWVSNEEDERQAGEDETRTEAESNQAAMVLGPNRAPFRFHSCTDSYKWSFGAKTGLGIARQYSRQGLVVRAALRVRAIGVGSADSA